MNLILHVVGKSDLRFLYVKVLGWGLQLKSNVLTVSFPWLVKSLKNLQIISLLITSRNIFFSWFSVWFQVFSIIIRCCDSCICRIARASNNSGAARLAVINVCKTFDGLLVFFSNSSLIKYLALFCHFIVIDSLKWFWMGSLCENIQLKLEFLKAPLLVLCFVYYT